MPVQELTATQNGATASHIKPTLDITHKDYMIDRVLYKMGVYEKKGKRERIYYRATSFAGIVISASVPVLINLNVNQIVPTLLGLMVTILVASEKLFHFREHWRNYDSVAASLRSEQLLFQTKSGVYEQKENHENVAFQLFVKRVEDLIKEERTDTIDMRTSEGTAK